MYCQSADGNALLNWFDYERKGKIVGQTFRPQLDLKLDSKFENVHLYIFFVYIRT